MERKTDKEGRDVWRSKQKEREKKKQGEVKEMKEGKERKGEGENERMTGIDGG